MAKKATTPAPEFNMAAAIRAELEKNRALSLKEAQAAVQAAHPQQTINLNSFGVAFSNQRKKLGIVVSRGKKVKRVPKAKATAQADSFGGLLAAKRYIREAGGLEAALENVRLVGKIME